MPLKYRSLFLVLLPLAVCIALAWRWIETNAFRAGTPGLVPDENTRAIANQIDPEDVRCLCFTGFHFAQFSHNALEVSDPDLIEQFVNALRDAERGQGPPASNATDDLEIDFKPQAHNPSGPIYLPFCVYSTQSAYGPEFIEALHALSDYQARQFRTLMEEKGNQIQIIEFVGGATIRDPADVQDLVSALKRIDGHAFSHTESSYWCSLRLRLRTGESTETLLMIGPYESNRPPDEQNPPVPSLLWKYCTQPAQSVAGDSAKK